MTSLFTDYGWAKSKKVEDKMFETFYNSLLNFAVEVEKGLACAVMDLNLGLIKKIRPNIGRDSQEIKYSKWDVKYRN